MDISLTEEQLLIQRTARDFATKEVLPQAAKNDEAHRFPADLVARMAELGFLGMAVPEQYGGAGLDTVSYALAMEEISRACASTGVIMSVNNSLVCDPILKFGTEELADARGWLTRELHIVQPRLVVAMGDETVAFLDRLDFPLADALDAGRVGEIQPFTPTIDALVTPDIDASLDEQGAKTRFWNAFKALDGWWSELPPY